MSYKTFPCGESNAAEIVSNGFSLEISDVRILFKKSKHNLISSKY